MKRGSTRIFMTPAGVKVRRVDRRYHYQPPTLKFTCIRVLNQHYRYPRSQKINEAIRASEEVVEPITGTKEQLLLSRYELSF